MTRAVEVPSMKSAGRDTKHGYIYESELPLTSLLFLLPLIVVYEVGTRYFTTAAQHGYEQQIIAFSMMQRFFRLLGVHGQHLPALTLAAILIFWHVARREKWQVNVTTLLGMGAESALLALPLIALSKEASKYLPLLASGARQHDLLIMSMGAGVYEEMVFRLIFFTLASLLLKDLFRVKAALANLWIVALGALAFSGYHYLSPAEHFQWRSFAFRTVAGLYFGVVFLLRGFGITAASHTAYDILILFL